MLRTIFLARKSDVLFLWGGEASWLAPFLAKMKRRGLVVAASNGLESHFDHFMEGYALEDVPRHYSSRLGALDGLIVISEFEREFALSHDVQDVSRTWLIENPLPPDFLNRGLLCSQAKRILFVGDWIERKGSTTLQGALPKLLDLFPSLEIVLVGNGTSLFRGQSPSVKIYDPGLDRGSLVDLYSRSTILVLPSEYESFGLVFAEAMACGTAVVATRTGFAYSLKDQQEVMHVKAGSSESLVAAVRELLERPELLATVRENGYRRVQSLSWENAKSRLAEMLADLGRLGKKSG